MASQRLARYLAVQEAKGVRPDPLEIAKMVREDAARPVGELTNISSVEPAQEEIRERRRALISGAGRPKSTVSEPFEGVIQSENIAFSPLEGQLVAEMTAPTIGSMALKGGIKGVTTAIEAAKLGVPIASSAIKGMAFGLLSPFALAIAFANTGVAASEASTISSNITSAFGEEAAQEAAAVWGGQTSLASVSPAAQNAYANAKVALENAPRTVAQKAYAKAMGKTAPPITSLVTPHHTEEAITEAFQAKQHAEAAAASGYGGGTLTGTDPNIGTNLALEADAWASQQALDAAMNAPGGVGGGSGGNVGAGAPGEGGIGPGNR